MEEVCLFIAFVVSVFTVDERCKSSVNSRLSFNEKQLLPLV